MKEQPTTTLDRLVRARYRVIVISTHEGLCVLEGIKRVAGTKRAVSPWSFTGGMKNMPTADPELTADPAAAWTSSPAGQNAGLLGIRLEAKCL